MASVVSKSERGVKSVIKKNNARVSLAVSESKGSE